MVYRKLSKRYVKPKEVPAPKWLKMDEVNYEGNYLMQHHRDGFHALYLITVYRYINDFFFEKGPFKGLRYYELNKYHRRPVVVKSNENYMFFGPIPSMPKDKKKIQKEKMEKELYEFLEKNNKDQSVETLSKCDDKE